ncbi:uncharacterized protein LOC117175729 isoform X2 [Belonocnema kinseyi]|uniref:uncharacterized protein LOC117175729 isoform X2 n=1 Tax=Belonocnema kinseyi TaxID=2817044 RepID=UPI00143D795C|nr:uncharacterized protein LOC117175729 isoform X2 [Belonocnema kinseyi]
MDIRGIEVTNQLRSAIRAKLLELGVRYDEELPDYILVMVVNKKSRQQMHEDLHLFLEDNTTPFVEWLHDQVLKKLQKVTVTKKKATKEFVPSVIVKQEEERNNRKTATSFLEDHTPTEEFHQLLGKNLKEDKEVEKEILTKLKLAHETGEASQNNVSLVSRKLELTDHSRKTIFFPEELRTSDFMKVIKPLQQSANLTHSFSKVSSLEPEFENNSASDKSITYGKRSKNTEQEDDFCNRDYKKLKSSVCKPEITSVVSVKNRLGIVSPRKNFQSQHNRANFYNRPRHGDQHEFEYSTHRNNIPRSRNLATNGNLRRVQGIQIKVGVAGRAIDIKRLPGRPRDGRLNMNLEARQKNKTKETLVHIVKNRLGSSTKILKQSTVKMQEINKDKIIASRKLEREQTNFRGKNVKYRLGPIRKKFNATNNTNDIEDEDHSVVNMASVKSHVVAVQKFLPEKTNRKKFKSNEKEFSDPNDEDCKDCQVPSKVIVTPRPLKPLQPTQKRATQSLLLRAVAEANQSVVKQRNPEPS